MRDLERERAREKRERERDREREIERETDRQGETGRDFILFTVLAPYVTDRITES